MTSLRNLTANGMILMQWINELNTTFANEHGWQVYNAQACHTMDPTTLVKKEDTSV